MSKRRVMLSLTCAAALLAASALAPSPAAAQDEAAPVPLEIGVAAPDFELPGGTRFGVLRDPVRLSDFAGKTVVLAFFFRARTRG